MRRFHAEQHGLPWGCFPIPPRVYFIQEPPGGKPFTDTYLHAGCVPLDVMRTTPAVYRDVAPLHIRDEA